MDYILEIENLTKHHKDSDFALDHVSFALPYGSIMGLVGANGAGKTTVISCILNTMQKNSGTVTLFGKEMTDNDIQLREKIGVVFDAADFSPHLDALQLSKVMQGVYTGWDQPQFLGYLEQFQIPAGKKIKSLSRGMAMKLSIAVALSHHPWLLILDEATGGLDPLVRDEILDVFLDFVQDETHAILLSSHITSDLEKIADYLAFIHNGKLLFTAKKDDLLYNYGVLRCGKEAFSLLDQKDMLAFCKRDYQVDVFIKNKKEVQRKNPNLVVDTVSIDEMMLLLVKGERI